MPASSLARTVEGSSEAGFTLTRAPGVTMSEPTGNFVGIDVSKAHLDVAVHRPASHWQVANIESGIAELVQRLHALHPTRIVLEATGGFELPLVAGLMHARLPVVVLNPRRVRDF